MALSNIKREPRREITESVVGIATFFGGAGLYLWGVYSLLVWLGVKSTGDFVFAMCMSLPGGFIAVVFLGFLLTFTHALGDTICDRLDGIGLHLRPRNRPR